MKFFSYLKSLFNNRFSHEKVIKPTGSLAFLNNYKGKLVQKKGKKVFYYEVEVKKRRKNSKKIKKRSKMLENGLVKEKKHEIEKNKDTDKKLTEKNDENTKQSDNEFDYYGIIDFAKLMREGKIDDWNTFARKRQKIRNMFKDYFEYRKWVGQQHIKIYGANSEIFQYMRRIKVKSLDRRVYFLSHHMHRTNPNVSETNIRECIPCVEKLFYRRIKKNIQKKLARGLRKIKHFLYCDKSEAYQRTRKPNHPLIDQIETIFELPQSTFGCPFHGKNELGEKLKFFNDDINYHGDEPPQYRDYEKKREPLHLHRMNYHEYCENLRDRTRTDRILENKMFINDKVEFSCPEKLRIVGFKAYGESEGKFVIKCLESCPFIGPIYYLYQRYGWPLIRNYVTLREKHDMFMVPMLECGCQIREYKASTELLYSGIGEPEIKRIKIENDHLKKRLEEVRRIYVPGREYTESKEDEETRAKRYGVPFSVKNQIQPVKQLESHSPEIQKQIVNEKQLRHTNLENIRSINQHVNDKIDSKDENIITVPEKKDTTNSPSFVISPENDQVNSQSKLQNEFINVDNQNQKIIDVKIHDTQPNNIFTEIYNPTKSNQDNSIFQTTGELNSVQNPSSYTIQPQNISNSIPTNTQISNVNNLNQNFNSSQNQINSQFNSSNAHQMENNTMLNNSIRNNQFNNLFNIETSQKSEQSVTENTNLQSYPKINQQSMISSFPQFDNHISANQSKKLFNDDIFSGNEQKAVSPNFNFPHNTLNIAQNNQLSSLFSIGQNNYNQEQQNVESSQNNEKKEETDLTKLDRLFGANKSSWASFDPKK